MLLTSTEVILCEAGIIVSIKGIALDLNRVIHGVLRRCHGIVAIASPGIAPGWELCSPSLQLTGELACSIHTHGGTAINALVTFADQLGDPR